MKKWLRKLLGIEALEEKVSRIEKSQTAVNKEKAPVLYEDVLDEWVNGEKGDGKQ